MTRTGKDNSQKNDEIASSEVVDELELNKPQADGTEDGVDISAVPSGGAQTTPEPAAGADAQSTPAEDSTEVAAESADQITALLDQVAE